MAPNAQAGLLTFFISRIALAVFLYALTFTTSALSPFKLKRVSLLIELVLGIFAIVASAFLATCRPAFEAVAILF